MNESKIELTERLRAEGRWSEASRFKDQVLRGLRGEGMKKAEAGDEAWRQMAEQFPPLPEAEAMAVSNIRVQGLGDVPAEWPELPSNASLQAELSWCQANRLRVVEERSSGAIRVHLERAGDPAPSLAALGWLETSIRTYSKYVDIVAKALKDEVDEADMVRRERMSIAEVRSLLAEMREDNGE